MAAFNSAIAVDQSDLIYGEQATINANATSNATADASSVDGIAEASANITDNSGLDQSTLTAGTGANVKVDVNGTAQADSATINSTTVGANTLLSASTSVTVSGNTYTADHGTLGSFGTIGIHNGDLIVNPDDGTKYYVVNKTEAAGVDQTFQLSSTPGGAALTGTAAIAALFNTALVETGTGTATQIATTNAGLAVISSSATSVFTGEMAGITDTDATDVDLKIGTAGIVDVDVNGLAESNAANIDGDAYATANFGAGGALGINETGIVAGTTATITADVDADALSVATSVGNPTATAVGGGADANADSDLTAVGINDFGASATTGNITVGTDATIRGAAGSSADRVTVDASATTQTGAATADADAANVAGILDAQSGDNTVANSITVGDAGTVTGLAYTNFDAVAASTTGAATADSSANNISGIQSDTIVIGTDGKVQGQANTQMDVSATVVDGITTGTGIAAATANIAQTKGVDLEVLTVGDSAAGTTGYNILGRTDADVNVSAASTGADELTDTATATGLIADAAGLELGNTSATTAGLTVGTNATVAGVAAIEMDASAASVDGTVTATSFVGDGATTNLETGAVGIELGDAASIGTNATVLAQGSVDLSATATNIGNQGATTDSPEAIASAGADFVSGLNIADAAVADTTNVAFGTNASITASGTATADATATSVTGDIVTALAGNGNTGTSTSGTPNTDVMDVRGLNSDDNITFGTTANVNADAKVDLTATASNTGSLGVTSVVTAKSNLESAVALDMVGLDGGAPAPTAGQFVTGTDAVVDADSSITGSASASSVEGSVTAESKTATNIGAQTSVVTIGDSANFAADAVSTQVATASTIGNGTATSDATATAAVEANYGLDSQAAFTVGTDAVISGVGRVTNTATATNVDESATATAGSTTSDIAGVQTTANLTVGTDATLISGTASATQTATATSVGLGAATGTNVVLSNAQALADTIEGIDIGNADLIAGTTASVRAAAASTNNATANSVDGNATAAVDINSTSGLYDGDVTIGTAGVIDADASSSSTARASTVDAVDAAVTAMVDNDVVQAINLTGLTTTTTAGILSTGTTLSLDADAVSSQIASASNIGDPTSAANLDFAATATVASGDQIFGITDTTISVGSNTTQLTSSATLVGDATASNSSSISTATAGGSTGNVVGLNNSATTIGNNATNGMSFQASSTLSADASSIEDDATANAGTAATPTFSSTTPTSLSLAGDAVIGVKSSDITVGQDAGTIQAGSFGRLEAIASTIGTGPSAADGADATALAAQASIGLLHTKVIIGNDGNLTGTANIAGSASSSNVGAIAGGNDAYSALQLDGLGISQAAADTITIGADGNVAGRGYVDGSATSTSVNGAAKALGEFDSAGFVLAPDANITIGQSGNISGLSVVGELSTTGSFADQMDVLASTTMQDATAMGDFSSSGIFGLYSVTPGDQTTLTAGPTDGDITGQALSGVNVVASTIGTSAGGSSIADLVGSVSGIQNVDMLGGMQGINTIKGTSFGDFDASATTIKGNATAASNTDAYGSYDAANDGTISLSGNIVAQAVLSNTVMASSVNGNASATATGDAIGMGGYDITILGSGSFTASANSSSDSDASSVKFGARA